MAYLILILLCIYSCSLLHFYLVTLNASPKKPMTVSSAAKMQINSQRGKKAGASLLSRKPIQMHAEVPVESRTDRQAHDDSIYRASTHNSAATNIQYGYTKCCTKCLKIQHLWEKRLVQVYSAANPSMPVDHPVFLPTKNNRCRTDALLSLNLYSVSK